MAEVRRLSDDGTARYRAVFTDPTAWRIWTAATISYFGDFVGLGALLLAGYSRSGGHPLGSAAVFGIQAVPAFAVSVFIGPWLDRIPRRGGLIALSILGGAAVSLPIIFSGLWSVLVAAAAIGGIRTAFNSIRTGAIADGVPRTVRGRLVALVTTSNQVSEVVGYVAGSSVAIAIGTGTALAADAATFVIAAALLAGLRLPTPARSPDRASMTTGIRTIFGDRTLALLVPVAWIGLALGAVPQSLAAAALKRRTWLGPRRPGGDGGRRGHLRHGRRPDGAERADPRPVRLHGRERRRLHAHRRRPCARTRGSWWPGTSWSASASAGPWRRRRPSFTSYLSSGWRTSPAR